MRSDDAAGPPAAVSSLDHYTRPLRTLLDDPSVTELCVQQPGEVLLERGSGWSRVAAPWATAAWARHFARLVATATEQRVNPETPLLSAALPTGERVQIVLPPATWRDHVVIAIRRPSREVWSLEELAGQGLFGRCRAVDSRPRSAAESLAGSFTSGEWRTFLAGAVRTRLNILVAGATGSGKTTLTKALIDEIPTDERLVSIEDAAELEFRHHDNSVRLFYSKDDQGRARVTPKQLLEASLRLRPDRILLAELRGEEAYYFLRNVSSGHPGSITSIHAGSAALAFEQLALLVKESPPGREMALADIHRLLHAVVDVVVHCTRDGASRRVSEVWWRDAPSTPRGSSRLSVRRPRHADHVCRHGGKSMLSLRPNCECCDRDLGADSTEAYICSFECTFCRACAEGTLHGICPNCAGELVRRPRRSESLLARYPASADRIVKTGGCRPST